MKKWLPLIALLIVLIGCRSGPKRFADNQKAILDPEKMEKVLVDIEIAEGALSVQSFQKDSSKRYARAYYRQVLDHHDVSVEKFQKSFTYYSQNPKVMISMQKSVLERISAKQGKKWSDEDE